MKEEYEYLFPESGIKFVKANAYLSLCLFSFVIIYSLVNGISFVDLDLYSNALTITVFVLFDAAQIAILSLSNWEKVSADALPGISLD